MILGVVGRSLALLGGSCGLWVGLGRSWGGLGEVLGRSWGGPGVAGGDRGGSGRIEEDRGTIGPGKGGSRGTVRVMVNSSLWGWGYKPELNQDVVGSCDNALTKTHLAPGVLGRCVPGG